MRNSQTTMIQPTIAIHGGAGVIRKGMLSPEKENDYRMAMQKALEAGGEILEKGGSACNAVEKAVQLLEDCPLFNAGKGSVFTNKGIHEMDASIMDGKTQNAGAVSKIVSVKNPINMARLVMEKSEYVYLSGREALDFAEQRDELAFEDNEYFFQQLRYDQLLAAQDTGKSKLDHAEMPNSTMGHEFSSEEQLSELHENKFGTVGAVALDAEGNLAAATSSGGLTNKKYGRVGDSAIIGAGTYANNESCAISCTGYGEYFIRAVAANDVSALYQYKQQTLQQACKEVIHNKIGKAGGQGGLIAIDKLGEVVFCFNTEGMYRGYKKKGETAVIEIYK